MTRTLFILVAVMVGAAPVGPATADDVPSFDVRTTCRAEAQGDAAAGAATVCLADEQRARDTLVSQWTQFAAATRDRCVQEAAGIAGIQSYIELLSCLQIAKDVKDLPNK
jgi:hypothetical protein